jgi:hypothetical protein
MFPRMAMAVVMAGIIAFPFRIRQDAPIRDLN